MTEQGFLTALADATREWAEWSRPGTSDAIRCVCPLETLKGTLYICPIEAVYYHLKGKFAFYHQAAAELELAPELVRAIMRAADFNAGPLAGAINRAIR